MKTTQPPITNDQGPAGYRAGVGKLLCMIERHKNDLMAERQRDPINMQRLDEIRYQLLHLYGYYRESRTPSTPMCANSSRSRPNFSKWFALGSPTNSLAISAG